MTDIYDVWLTRVAGTNQTNARRIAQLGLTPRELYDMRDSLFIYPVFSDKQLKNAQKISLEDVQKFCDEYENAGVHSMNYTDREFPKRLSGFSHRPLVIYYKGDISLLSAEHTVAVVGSRRCNGEGEKACQIIGRDIAEDGGVVISGLAQGVDVTSQRACTDAGGRTVAFIGTPLTQYYPKANEDYQRRLEQTDLVVSEYIHGLVYHSSNFVDRNRLIARAGDALCVVQATFKSGSLSTVNRALDMGKTVFCVPGSIFSEFYSGSNQLLYDGKRTAVKDGHSIMAFLSGDEKPKKSRQQTKEVKSEARQLSLEASRVLDSIDGAVFSSQIVRRTGLTRAQVRANLTLLEVEGLVTHTDNGEYIRKNDR